MTHQLRHVLSRVPLGVISFIFGSVLAGIVFAAPPPDPTPSVPVAVREQNLDANGWIKVHDQGTTNVSGTVEVNGDVAISNFPATQDVNVIGGQLALTMPTVTAGFSDVLCLDAGQLAVFPLPAVINATNVDISNSSDEVALYFQGPIAMAGAGKPLIAGPSVLSFEDHDGEGKGFRHAFTRPVPISQVTVYCTNESNTCCPLVNIIGDVAP